MARPAQKPGLASSLVLLGLILVSACDAGARRERRGALGGLNDDDDGGGVVVDAEIEGVTITRDLAYGPDPAQRFDLYRPSTARGPLPIIVMVHGGGWRRGDKRGRGVVQHKVEAWVQTGQAVLASINYRMDPPNPDVEAHDVAAAAAFFQRNSPRFGLDPNRVVLMGHSAGAHLVSLVGVAPRYAQATGMQPVASVVSIDSGSIDVEETMRRPHFDLYDGPFGADPAFWKRVSPLAQLGLEGVEGTPPIFVACSTRRRDACPQAERLKAKAAPLGVRVVVAPQDLTHASINSTLGQQPSTYTTAVSAFLRETAAIGAPTPTPTPTTSPPPPAE